MADAPPPPPPAKQKHEDDDNIPDFGEDSTLIQRRIERVAHKSSGPKLVPVTVKHKTHAASARYNVKRADDLAALASRQQSELSAEKKCEKLAKKLKHSRTKREKIHKTNRQLKMSAMKRFFQVLPRHAIRFDDNS